MQLYVYMYTMYVVGRLQDERLTTIDYSLCRVKRYCSYTFLVVGEDCLCFPSSQVPESDGAVMTASYHLKQCEIHMYMYMSSRRAEEMDT